MKQLSIIIFYVFKGQDDVKNTLNYLYPTFEHNKARFKIMTILIVNSRLSRKIVIWGGP